MNRTQRKFFGVGSLTVLGVVFFLGQFQSYSEQKTTREIEALLNQLPNSSVVAVSSKWKNATPLPTVPFPNLARSSETSIRAALRARPAFALH